MLEYLVRKERAHVVVAWPPVGKNRLVLFGVEGNVGRQIMPQVDELDAF
jgi:hypothetical protein